jgi:hypothetical protein
MNDCRLLVERYWQGKTEVLRQKPVWTPIFIINKTWSFQGTRPGLHAERPASNCLGHGTGYRLSVFEMWWSLGISHIYQVLPSLEMNEVDHISKTSCTQSWQYTENIVCSTHDLQHESSVFNPLTIHSGYICGTSVWPITLMTKTKTWQRSTTQHNMNLNILCFNLQHTRLN